MKDLALQNLVGAWVIFCGSIVGKDLGIMLRGKKPHKPEIAHDILCIQSSVIFTNPIEYKLLAIPRLFVALLSLYIKTKSSGHYHHWTVRKLTHN